MKNLFIFSTLLLFFTSPTQAINLCEKLFLPGDSRASFDIKLDEIQAQKEKEIKEALLSCPRLNLQKCLADKIETASDPMEPTNSKFLRDVFKNSCLLKGRGNSDLARRARSSYALTAAISLTSIVGGYYSRAALGANNHMPIGYIVYAQILGLVTAEVACRNVANKENVRAGNVSPGRMYWENYKSYMKLNVVGDIAYVGLVMTEDYLRGEDVTTEEKLSEYLATGVLAIGWDAGLSGLQVFYLDKLFINSIPQFRESFTKAIQEKAISNVKWITSQNTLVLTLSQVPGYTMEIGTRWMYSYLRSVAWLSASEAIKDEEQNPTQD